MICPSCGYDNIPGQDRCEGCFHSLMNADLPCPDSGERIQNVMMSTPVSEILREIDWLVAEETDTIANIVKVLNKEKKACVAVVKKKRLTGIITQRDILFKVGVKYPDLTKVTAADIMTPKPEHVLPSEPINYAINKMATGGFRRLPVLSEEGVLLSIVAIKDVLKYFASSDKRQG